MTAEREGDDDMRIQCPKCSKPVNYAYCPYCGADQDAPAPSAASGLAEPELWWLIEHGSDPAIYFTGDMRHSDPWTPDPLKAARFPSENAALSARVHYELGAEERIAEHMFLRLRPAQDRDAERYRWLRQHLQVAADGPNEWTCWLALACIPYRSKTDDAETLLDELMARFPLADAAMSQQEGK